jgi:hypothetical protein
MFAFSRRARIFELTGMEVTVERGRLCDESDVNVGVF